MSSYMDAMQVLVPGARCTINEKTGEVVEWYGADAQPTDEQLKAQRETMNNAAQP